jgi:hypothetical protein
VGFVFLGPRMRTETRFDAAVGNGRERRRARQ